MFAVIGELLAQVPSVSKSRVHPEWRIVTSVITFCGAAGLSTSLWRQEVGAANSILLVSVCLLAGVLAAGALKKRLDSLLLILISLFLLGVFIGQCRILQVRQDFLITQSYVQVTGVVKRLDEQLDGPARLLLRPDGIRGYEEALPKLIRVSVRTAIDPSIRAGSSISFSAKLSIPNGPVVPGGYDFSRTAFFGGVGANAIALSPIAIAGPVIGIEDDAFGVRISQLREQIEASLLKYMDGQAGGVAVALTVGFRNHLSNETKEVLRRAGLSHLLAISGLHMGLVTASAFFIFEFLLAAVASVGVRVMPRKLAVLPTWLVAILYLLLSGASTSTLRAFIMVSVALLAVLTDRKVLSLRSVALAAFFIVLWRPESVLSVGFQMSFAATAGLVAFFEMYNTSRARQRSALPNKLYLFFGYLLAIGITSLVAQLSVAPFSIYHFQSLSVVGLLANILALPVMTFLVMPLLFIGVLLTPTGGLWVLASPIEYGLNYILGVAAEVAALPHAVLFTEPVSDLAFLVAVLAMLVLLIVREVVLNTVAITCVLGCLLLGTNSSASVLVSNSGKIVSVFRSGVVFSVGGRGGSFRGKMWLQYWGENPNEKAEILSRHCDAGGCGYDILGNESYSLTYIKALSSLKPACAAGNIVFVPQRYARYCRGSALLVTLEELERRGPLGIHLAEKGQIKIEWSQPR